MITQIRFIKMERSEAVETFVNDELESLQHHIPRNKEAHFRVWLESINPGQGNQAFRCAVEIDGVAHKQFFVEKRDGSFHRAFHQCIGALDKVFRQEKRMTTKNKRHPRLRNQNIAS